MQARENKVYARALNKWTPRTPAPPNKHPTPAENGAAHGKQIARVDWLRDFSKVMDSSHSCKHLFISISYPHMRVTGVFELKVCSLTNVIPVEYYCHGFQEF